MLIVNTVEINGKYYLMQELPEDRKEELLEAFIKYDERYRDMEVLDSKQLEEVKIKLTEQSAKAMGYRRVGELCN